MSVGEGGKKERHPTKEGTAPFQVRASGGIGRTTRRLRRLDGGLLVGGSERLSGVMCSIRQGYSPGRATLVHAQGASCSWDELPSPSHDRTTGRWSPHWCESGVAEAAGWKPIRRGP